MGDGGGARDGRQVCGGLEPRRRIRKSDEGYYGAAMGGCGTRSAQFGRGARRWGEREAETGWGWRKGWGKGQVAKYGVRSALPNVSRYARARKGREGVVRSCLLPSCLPAAAEVRSSHHPPCRVLAHCLHGRAWNHAVGAYNYSADGPYSPLCVLVRTEYGALRTAPPHADGTCMRARAGRPNGGLGGPETRPLNAKRTQCPDHAHVASRQPDARRRR